MLSIEPRSTTPPCSVEKTGFSKTFFRPILGVDFVGYLWDFSEEQNRINRGIMMLRAF